MIADPTIGCADRTKSNLSAGSTGSSASFFSALLRMGLLSQRFGTSIFSFNFSKCLPLNTPNLYFSFAESLETLFQTPVDLVETKAIDNSYFLSTAEASKVPLYELG